MSRGAPQQAAPPRGPQPLFWATSPGPSLNIQVLASLVKNLLVNRCAYVYHRV